MHIPSLATRVAILLLVAVPAIAAPLTVSVDGSRVTTAPQRFNVTVEGADGIAVHGVVPWPGSAQFDVHPGTYRIDVADPSYWADARAVYVSDGGASVQVMAYRASTLTGRVIVKASDGRTFENLTVRFQSADDPSAGPRGETTCDIVRRSFACRVPAVRLDLSLKAVGCVTRYRWGVDGSASRADVGEIDLAPGALLTGYVAAQRGVSLEKAMVYAAPRRAAPSSGDAGDTKSPLLLLSAPVNAQGFFHFDGIAPGEYTVEAALASRKSARATVRVIASTEAEVREPFVLEEPHDVDVAIEPPRDPYNRRWSVRLERRTGVDMVVETERQELLEEGGRATLRAIPAGDYTLVLRSQGGETWAQREITVPAISLVEITLPKTSIRGMLTLGGQPLSADLEFHGDAGVAIAAHSGSDGRFAFFFPQADLVSLDRVRVRSTAPRIDRVLHEVTISRDGEGKRNIAIDLPATYLTGVVVDAGGRPVTTAVVRLQSLHELAAQEVPVDGDGSFEVYALDAGPVELRAYSAKATSDAMSLDVAGSERAPDVRLVLKPTVHLTGRILSGSGPVPGAVVYAFPCPRGGFLAPVQATGADGRYDISFPGQTADVDLFVTTPAFATQYFRHRLTRSGDLDLMLSQTSGALSIDDPEEANLVIHHRGAEVGIKLFAYHGAVRNGSVFRIANLEPGAYTICRSVLCTAATVVPHGEVYARVK
jgi:hypothetical protein